MMMMYTHKSKGSHNLVLYIVQMDCERVIRARERFVALCQTETWNRLLVFLGISKAIPLESEALVMGLDANEMQEDTDGWQLRLNTSGHQSRHAQEYILRLLDAVLFRNETKCSSHALCPMSSPHARVNVLMMIITIVKEHTPRPEMLTKEFPHFENRVGLPPWVFGVTEMLIMLNQLRAKTKQTAVPN